MKEAPFYMGTKVVLPVSGLQASFATHFYHRVFLAEEIDRRYLRAKFAGTFVSVPHLAYVMQLPTGERFIVFDVVTDTSVDPESVVKVVRKLGLPRIAATVAAPPFLNEPVANELAVSTADMLILPTPEVNVVTDRALRLSAIPIRDVTRGNAFGVAGQGENSVIQDPFGYWWQISTPQNA